MISDSLLGSSLSRVRYLVRGEATLCRIDADRGSRQMRLDGLGGEETGIGQVVAGMVLLVGLFTISGCVTTGPVEPPEITLVDLKVVEVTVFETTMSAAVRIDNPNPEPLAVQGASFRIILDGRKIGTGMTPEEFTVERLGSEVVEVPVHVNNASLLLRLREILGADSISYGIRGTLFVDGGWGTRRLKVQRQGQLELRGRARAGAAAGQ